VTWSSHKGVSPHHCHSWVDRLVWRSRLEECARIDALEMSGRRTCVRVGCSDAIVGSPCHDFQPKWTVTELRDAPGGER
jgi:hypothetical protein